MATILREDEEIRIASARPEGDRLWMPMEALEQATGWSLKPEGFCQGPQCVPIPPGREGEFLAGEEADAAALWRHLGHPVAHDAAGEVWLLGIGAARRAAELGSLQAPDFTLPDLEGRPHSLSQYRGKKVLLATWASW